MFYTSNKGEDCHLSHQITKQTKMKMLSLIFPKHWWCRIKEQPWKAMKFTHIAEPATVFSNIPAWYENKKAVLGKHWIVCRRVWSEWVSTSKFKAMLLCWKTVYCLLHGLKKATFPGEEFKCLLVPDWSCISSNVNIVSLCHSEEGCEPKEKALDLLVDAHSDLHLWS